ncbi:hypothetical protein [Paenibacillus chitinolyticus]|uniref:hypothetical protein n=1 Tax=Paenibacillus chitinolyticus TaxID=79263 RepID=UPI001C4720A7|nr:hypothetical protein [Paenibacillus chitinolyticus]MBV6717207.1 hypothetical protein [Paenibacillus chitinolyticus]
MYGYIASREYSQDIKEALEENNIFFQETGEFTPDSFKANCQAAAHANVQTLIIDLGCTDDGSIIKGIQQFRILRDSRIIVIAPGRTPGDSTINALIKLQVLDVIAPEVGSELEEEDIRPSIAPLIKHQLGMKPAYGNVMRWDVTTGEIAERKQKIKENKERQKETSVKYKQNEPDPDILEHFETLHLESQPAKEKLLLMETIIGSILVALIGAEHSVGTTHTTLLLANYLTRKGYSVAVIEASEKNDFAALEYAYEGRKGFTSSERMFEMRGADYYKAGLRVDLSEFKEYDYILLDLGDYQDTEYFEEFKRAHVQIVVGHGSEWRQKRLYEFSRANERLDQSNYIYCVPFVDKIVLQDINEELSEGKVFSVPAHPDPYKAKKETDALFDTLMKDYLGQRRSTTPTWLLYSVIAAALIVIILLIILLAQK